MRMHFLKMSQSPLSNDLLKKLLRNTVDIGLSWKQPNCSAVPSHKEHHFWPTLVVFAASQLACSQGWARTRALLELKLKPFSLPAKLASGWTGYSDPELLFLVLLFFRAAKGKMSHPSLFLFTDQSITSTRTSSLPTKQEQYWGNCIFCIPCLDGSCSKNHSC